MSWSHVERVLEEAAKHSTIFGKIWILSAFFLRLVFIMRIGDTVYHDEQSQFTCNIRQPGCSNVCFNLYSPISFIRFSAFHMIMVTLPVVVYILYAAHTVTNAKHLQNQKGANAPFKPQLDRLQLKKLIKEADIKRDLTKKSTFSKQTPEQRRNLVTSSDVYKSTSGNRNVNNNNAGNAA